jgi:hypothetical protein
MLVTYSKNYFSIYNKDNASVRIKTTEKNFDEILTLFLDVDQTKEKKRPRKIRFE